MKKLLFVLLFSFVLAGCSNTGDNENVEEVIESATVQADATEETTELTTEEVATTEMAQATENATMENTTTENAATEETVTEETVTTETEATQQTDEASDYYAVCTSHSKEEVEMFAQKVKDYIRNNDWESLAGTISYPITVGDVECSNAEDFKNLAFDEIFTDDFYTALENESCKDMFCNYGGIMLGDGQVWIGEVLEGTAETGDLMVIGINL